jgi:two-component system, chemotaxis family, chemotaxis protein CheY
VALILVIDDDARVRRTMVRVLTGAGHSVIEAEEGQKGIVLLCEEKPDLVITDLVMPGKDGIETIREIREISPEMKIVAISGTHAGADGGLYLRAAEKLGADAILPKPFRAPEVLGTVERLLTGA